MPRSRRRHHSRSRTRSRSNSVERTRDVKRRKIDSYEETHKRSLSSETVEPDEVVTATEKMETSTTEESTIVIANEETDTLEKSQESVASSSANDESKSDCEIVKSTNSKGAQSLPSKLKTSEVTPKKALSPLQLQKRLESAKRREEKEKEREEKRLKLLEEKKLMRDEKERQRLEKQEQKQKELEMKEDKRKKEQEEKELKRKKEQEEKEMKRKEKEEKIEQKRKEIEEKTKEKQKEENKKQKISAAFVNFFTKKPEAPLEKKVETVVSSTFMPFEVKSDMRLAPLCRKHLSDKEKNHCLTSIKQQGCTKTYLEELKNGKEVGTDAKTWIDDEVDTDAEVIIVENLGESIVHQTDSTQKWRAKFLKFHENRRPAYYGTWRKKSKVITPIKPFSIDEDFFNYDADSDDDWEEEEPGESVGGSDDEEKDEPEIDYDYDNFLVPHGYLSDSEVNDEEDAVANPEDHKLKLKILKKEFDDEMSEKAHKLKPRMIGCIWYNKNEMNVDENTHSFLKPYFIIAREQIKIKKRLANEVSNLKPSIKSSPKSIANPLEDELIPEFLKFVHGSSVSQRTLVKEYLKILKDKGINCDASQKSLSLQLRTLAEWKKSQNKFCWCVRETVMKDYKVELPHV